MLHGTIYWTEFFNVHAYTHNYTKLYFSEQSVPRQFNSAVCLLTLCTIAPNFKLCCLLSMCHVCRHMWKASHDETLMISCAHPTCIYSDLEG